MNTKFFAYAIAAMLIGFAVMMLPLALEEAPPAFQPSWQPYTGEAAQDKLREMYGLDSQPSNITSSSLILLVGLIIAFAAYLVVKKQVNPPPAFSNSYKPF
jgi:hypothetical protein